MQPLKSAMKGNKEVSASFLPSLPSWTLSHNAAQNCGNQCNHQYFAIICSRNRATHRHSVWQDSLLLVPSWQLSQFLCCALQESFQINLLFVFKELDTSLHPLPRWVKWQACHFIFILILNQIRRDFYSGQLSKQADRATPSFSSSSLGRLKKKSSSM